MELHAAKTRLGTGSPGQQRARNSAQTAGKEQASSSRARPGLAVTAPALACAGDGDVLQHQWLLPQEPLGDAPAGDVGGFTT